MNRTETEFLLRKISAVDNRRISDDVIDGWHQIVGFMSLDVALHALTLCRRDERITYLEPKHIVARGRDAMQELHPMKPETYESAVGVSQPVCRKHDLPIIRCTTCCQTISDYARDNKHEDIQSWAERTIFKVENESSTVSS